MQSICDIPCVTSLITLYLYEQCVLLLVLLMYTDICIDAILLLLLLLQCLNYVYINLYHRLYINVSFDILQRFSIIIVSLLHHC